MPPRRTTAKRQSQSKRQRLVAAVRSPATTDTAAVAAPSLANSAKRLKVEVVADGPDPRTDAMNRVQETEDISDAEIRGLVDNLDKWDREDLLTELAKSDLGAATGRITRSSLPTLASKRLGKEPLAPAAGQKRRGTASPPDPEVVTETKRLQRLFTLEAAVRAAIVLDGKNQTGAIGAPGFTFERASEAEALSLAAARGYAVKLLPRDENNGGDAIDHDRDTRYAALAGAAAIKDGDVSPDLVAWLRTKYREARDQSREGAEPFKQAIAKCIRRINFRLPTDANEVHAFGVGNDVVAISYFEKRQLPGTYALLAPELDKIASDALGRSAIVTYFVALLRGETAPLPNLDARTTALVRAFCAIQLVELAREDRTAEAANQPNAGLVEHALRMLDERTFTTVYARQAKTFAMFAQQGGQDAMRDHYRNLPAAAPMTTPAPAGLH